MFKSYELDSVDMYGYVPVGSVALIVARYFKELFNGNNTGFIPKEYARPLEGKDFLLYSNARSSLYNIANWILTLTY